MKDGVTLLGDIEPVEHSSYLLYGAQSYQRRECFCKDRIREPINEFVDLDSRNHRHYSLPSAASTSAISARCSTQSFDSERQPQ